ncbi:MAG: PCRF domain-containing protein, partial [Candidatus Krumholzibacteria bacterium]|nr:PCRF domain-containing protein [Candidatus Krumholzibacteria bacterium]
MNDPKFWQDKNRSEKTLREVSSLKSKIEPVRSLHERIDESAEFLELAKEEGDDSLVESVSSDLGAAEQELGVLEITTLYSGPDDERDAILSIHPGAGGTESQDW